MRTYGVKMKQEKSLTTYKELTRVFLQIVEQFNLNVDYIVIISLLKRTLPKDLLLEMTGGSTIKHPPQSTICH